MRRPPPEVTERLTEDEFDKTFGLRLAQAIAFNPAGRCVVNSALTRTRYVFWDWAAGRYVVERR
jgi:hypothetical protein